MFKKSLFAGLGIALLASPFVVSAQTTGDVQSRIQALLVQVAQLQSQIAQLRTASLAPVAAGDSTSQTPAALPDKAIGCPVINRALAFGASGSDVGQLQQYLEQQGVFNGQATGYFGSQTQAAVQAWQAQNGIVSSGDPISTGYGVVGGLSRGWIGQHCKGGGGSSGNLSAAPTSGPAPLSVVFRADNSKVSDPAISYVIDYGDGSQDTMTEGSGAALSAGHTYQHSGTFTATLSSDENICGGISGYGCDRVLQVGSVTISAGSVTSSSCMLNGQSVGSGQSVTAYQSASVPSGQSCVSETRTCSNGTLSGSYQNASCTVGAAASCTFNGQTVPSGQAVTAYQSPSVPTGQQCISQQRTCSNGTLSGSYTNGSCTVGSLAVNNYSPIGFFDSLDAQGNASGWTLDQDTPSQSTSVAIYMDGDKASGTLIATVPANSPRPDVDSSLGVSGNHGFVWQIPAQYLTTSHTWYAYGVDSGDPTVLKLLSNSPRTYTPPTPTPLPAPTSGANTLDLHASVVTTTAAFMKYLYSFPLPGTVTFTGITGSASTDQSSPNFSESLMSVHYLPSGTCPQNGEVYSSYDQISAKYNLPSLANFIVKNASGGLSTVSPNIAFPVGMPISNCVVIILDGSILNVGGPFTMTSGLTLHYTTDAPAESTSIVGLDDEFCFGQNWGCQIASTDTSGSFAKIVPITSPVKLLALYGDISDSSFDSSGNFARPPIGAWGTSNDFYIIKNCAQMPQGIVGPGNFYSQLPAGSVDLLSVAMQGSGQTTLQQPVYKTFTGVTLDPGDCIAHLVKMNGSGGVDAEDQVFALFAPNTTASATDSTGNLANALTALESALKALIAKLGR